MKARKVCMIGDFAVGKTSLVSRFVHSTFDERYLTTVGVKIDTRKITLPSGDDIKLVLWDIAGKSAFARIDSSYLRDASAYLLVVDGTRPATLDHAIELQAMTEEQLGTRPFGVLLNKSDLNDRWALDRERIADLESRGWAVALLDAEKDHAEQQARQQAAHELELLQEERERLIRELEQANRLKSDFIARMSHEFRTPLTSVIGYSDQLREIAGDDPQTAHHLQAIGRGARYLLNLVENLLDQARIEIDQLTLNPNGCDLHDMSDEVEQLLRPVARQDQLSLAWWFDAEIPPRLWLDSTRLKQIMINLVGNAIKFTQQGGVSVEFGWSDGRLQVSVSDTGPGIAKNDLAAIFEPFRQGQDGARAKGAGLGLAISRTLVRAMGGEITVSSEPGTGSRFEFSIRAEAVKGGRASDTNALRGKTVLVADDDADLLELLRLYLNSAGLQVKTCTDAAGALETIHSTVADVALLDLHLASDDGVALAQRMREAGFDEPIVLLSASPPDDGANPDKPGVFDARWLKPISRARLIEGLAELLA